MFETNNQLSFSRVFKKCGMSNFQVGMPNGIPQNGLSYPVQRLSTTIQGRGGGLNPSEKYESIDVTWHKNLPEWTVIKFQNVPKVPV